MAVKDLVVPGLVGTDTIKWLITRGLGNYDAEVASTTPGVSLFRVADPTATTMRRVDNQPTAARRGVSPSETPMRRGGS